MANSLFDQFKSTLSQALQDQDFRRKNAIYNDEDFLAKALARIQSLTPDVSISLDFDDVISVLGMVSKDESRRQIRFDTAGFETTLSAFREGSVSSPRRLWKRDNSADTDGVRYLLSDRDSGVFLLNDALEITRRFPHFGPNLLAGDDYESSNSAVTFTVSGTEYIAIACYSRHVVRIYEYNAPFSLVATIGTVDVNGATAALLDNPISLAVDETNDQLYIACENGTPAGATLDRGFITIYDVSTPASPVHQQISHFYVNTGSLLDGEVNTPTDIFYDNGSDLLWVSNGGSNEVGSFTIDTATPVYSLTKYIEPSGHGYTLRTPEQVFVQELLGGYKRIYVANGATGTIEEYDFVTTRHQASYGYRASEDELNLFNRLSDSVYGAIGYAQGAMADRILINDQEVDVLITADTLNRRLARFNLNAYTADNFANFQLMTFDVPLSINGWTLNGTLPLDMVKVFYRFSETEDFRELPQETTIPPSSSLQFRISIKLDPRKFVNDWHVRYLRIHGTQA